MTQPLTVATFNVRNGRAWDGWNSWWLRRRATAAMVRALDADVVGLQEVFPFQLRYLRRTVGGFDAVGRFRDDGKRGEGCPLLVRTARLVTVEHATRWFGDRPEEAGSSLPGARFPRIATVARVDDRAVGATYTVASAHLDAASAERRRRSAAQLIGWLGDGPAVVLADLNGVDALAVLLDAGLVDARPHGAPATFHRFTGAIDGPRIDYVLVSHHFAVERADVVHTAPGARLPSDHWPVRAVVHLR